MLRGRTPAPRLGILSVILLFVAVPACQAPPNRIVGAGDIASCAWRDDSRTAALLDYIAGTVVTFGDNAYPAGTASDFANCYGPTWGRHNGRVRPSVGNHEYLTSGGSGYFNYFGGRAGPWGRGYYHFDIGSWRVFSLNSEARVTEAASYVRRNAGGKDCIAAFWHRPLVSSGPHGNSFAVFPLWQAVYDVGGDFVLNGHDHGYERFAELDRSGAPRTGGMREFVVGTGGAPLYDFGAAKPGSRVRNSSVHGVIAVDLRDSGYSWRFHPVAGSFSDSGTGGCS